ncbi:MULTISPECIES: helix-turn-helix domain-containing protein [unclassified Amycolatopsis]|uniref:helix-turn-helix domain-containing protein n=1 Tax=unclassified Amycolatopsis TaxID=2618356 RepID=UPI00287B7EB7|nr:MULTISPECIES: helix-turn-helix domain-containing protein [unclassified Amycolatopsis]
MYEERAAPAVLRGVARCVWRSASEGPKRIVPDGCVDLVVGGGTAFVAGPDTAAWWSETEGVVSGVRLVPGRAAAVLGVAADELRDRRVPVSELWGRSSAERLVEGVVSPVSAVAERVTGVPPPDFAVAELIARLEAGVARVGDAAALLGRSGAAALGQPAAGGVSERRLRRRFVQAVGYGPATYLRVSRFQRAVALAPRVPGLAALAAAAGYADQAHLSRDCRALTGLTPRDYFGGRSTVDVAVRDRLRSA